VADGRLVSGKLVESHVLRLANFLLQPLSWVLDGWPIFAPAYLGRKRSFQMLSLYG
jgi:hypothetical protein